MLPPVSPHPHAPTHSETHAPTHSDTHAPTICARTHTPEPQSQLTARDGPLAHKVGCYMALVDEPRTAGVGGNTPLFYPNGSCSPLSSSLIPPALISPSKLPQSCPLFFHVRNPSSTLLTSTPNPNIKCLSLLHSNNMYTF